MCPTLRTKTIGQVEIKTGICSGRSEAGGVLWRVGTGRKPIIVLRRSSLNLSEEGSWSFKNWRGRIKSEPYTAPEAQVAESSLGVACKPRRTYGKCSNKSAEAMWAHREIFNGISPPCNWTEDGMLWWCCAWYLAESRWQSTRRKWTGSSFTCDDCRNAEIHPWKRFLVFVKFLN